MHRSTLIKHFPPFLSLLQSIYVGHRMQPSIHRHFFLDFLSKSFSVLDLHRIIPTPYLSIATAHVFIAFTLFLPFNSDFKINLCLHLYSSVIFSFISVSLILSNSMKPKYVYPSCPICFITSSSDIYLTITSLQLSLHFLRFWFSPLYESHISLSQTPCWCRY